MDVGLCRVRDEFNVSEVVVDEGCLFFEYGIIVCVMCMFMLKFLWYYV